MNLRKLALASLFTAAAGIPAVTMADSELSFGGSATAAADLNFSIVIPQFVYFQVGASAAPGTLDTVSFNLAGAESGWARTSPTVTDRSTSNPSIPVPAFGASAAPVVGPINATGTWSFAYDNTGVYTAGTYTDTVTYTAATP
jgi:hypothetical protein